MGNYHIKLYGKDPVIKSFFVISGTFPISRKIMTIKEGQMVAKKKMKTLKPTIQAVIVIIPGKMRGNDVGSWEALRDNIIQLKYDINDSIVEQYNTILHEFTHIASHLFSLRLTEGQKEEVATAGADAIVRLSKVIDKEKIK